MSFFRRTSFGPPLLAMLLALVLGFGLARSPQAKDALRNPIGAASGTDLTTQLDLFSNVLYLVQNQYVDAPDNSKLMRGAIEGMLKTLDPHSLYLPPQRADRMDEDFRGEYSGIGVQFEIRDGKIVVLSPMEGTPSYRLGIRAGDRIVEIEDKPLAKPLTTEDVFKALRGPAGSTVRVAIEREGEPELLRYAIERAKIPIESIPYSFIIRPGVGYVRPIRFAQTTGEELEEAVIKLKGQGMKHLLIDLRSNSGGLLSQAVDVLDQLVPKEKLLVYTRGRAPSANSDYRSSGRVKQADLPVVVLIDHGSASASEIVAGAVQDLDRGLVAGTNSFGKGLVQNQFRLNDGSKLLLTIAHYYTPSGRVIQRDYSKFGDREEYALEAHKDDVPSDSVMATRPKFKTGAGRTVYGGGGIYPDVVIKDPPLLTRPQADMMQKRVFFEFATHYVAQRKGQKWTVETLGPDFKLADSDWAGLRKVMDDRKVALTDSVWTADRPFMHWQVRAELASATMGSLARYRVICEQDDQLTAAIDLFPRASKLLAEGAATAKKSHP
ncbi:MAG: S41 family peptidase [Candidatus Eisenbacteria bacterium]